MQLGMIGLGRMGANMVRRLEKAGHNCVVYDRTPAVVQSLVADGATGSSSLDDFVAKPIDPVVLREAIERYRHKTRGRSSTAPAPCLLR